MTIKGIKSFKREDSHAYMKSMIDEFLAFYQKNNYIIHPSVKISSDIDKSVRFIGSHISVLKPYFLTHQIPQKGYAMTQPCIRTRNLKNYADIDYYPNWGSMFHSLGALVNPNQLEDITKQTFEFMKESWGITNQDLRIRINSNDIDLLDIAYNTFPENMIEINTMPEQYYRHKLGIEGVCGRNFNLALKDKNTQKYADFGNVIILEDSNQQLGAELALGASAAFKQIHGLSHVLDCHPVLGLDKYIKNDSIRVKLEDCIITTFALYNEEFEPSNKTNSSRLMKKYLQHMSEYVALVSLSKEALYKTLYQYESLEYNSKDILTPKLVNDLENFSQECNPKIKNEDKNNAHILALYRQKINGRS